MKTIILKHHKIYCRFDIQKRHINHKGEFVITAGLSNNGVLGQSDIKAKVFESHTITIDMFGCAFYRSFAYKMVTHARVFSLKPKFEINHKIGLFLSTLFFGYPKKFGYENMCSWAKIKNDKVILPLKPTAKTQTLNDIDFDFMEKFIAELEQCRLAELQAYLKATGLENTTLSNDEENALNVFNNKNSGGGNTSCGLTWQSFRLGDLFEKVSARFLGKGDKFKATSKSITDTHNIPLVYCKKGNNGIMYWGKKGDFETYNNIISIIYNGVIATGLTYAHRDEVGILAESYFIKFKNGNPNFLCNLFIKTAIEKVLYPKYSRDNLATWANKVENELILLPTKQHGGIDFDFMRTLINALMKQTIQGVAEYCGAKIQATKEAISQETPIQKDSLF
ncbi:restriction endonuclease subunit S [Helicobacter pylori]|nr:restriction endonuclease subunit S [Helicobacter pylori]